MSPLRLLVVAPLLVACGSYTPRHSDLLRIDSDPAGAEVYSLGERIGVTPLEVAVTRVFPAVYPPEKEALYGRVVLRKPGCEERQVAVSTGAVAKGLRVKLECGSAAPVPGGADVRARLKRLDELRQEGVISDEEYAAQRQRILGEL